MADYNHNDIESRWQQYWRDNEVFKTEINHEKPKYYVLDMFPYPSGAGLHVGHPLGYIASDIYSRYKRQQGFNVLHPMGYDAYGLPAEQYAIQTGQHPEKTTNDNIARYRSQLDKIGFSFDWSREVRTCDPKYYKWTQWAFMPMFNQGTPYIRTRRPSRKAWHRWSECSGDKGTLLYSRTMEHNDREGKERGPYELAHSVPGRDDGQLVSGTGHGARQR